MGHSPENDSSLWQAYVDLPVDALADRVPEAGDYYVHATSSPDAMDEMGSILQTETPPLGNLRTAFRGDYLTLGWQDSTQRMPAATAATLAEEFDLSLLAIHFTPELREPLQNLSDPDLMAGNLDIGVTKATMEAKNRQQFFMDLITHPHHLKLALLSGALNRNMEDKVSETGEFVLRHVAHHMAIYTVAASLDRLREHEDGA